MEGEARGDDMEVTEDQLLFPGTAFFMHIFAPSNYGKTYTVQKILENESRLFAGEDKPQIIVLYRYYQKKYDELKKIFGKRISFVRDFRGMDWPFLKNRTEKSKLGSAR
jgi:hypothetical protein